jgi:predicted N-formylglutamate amidohydrolase
VAVTSSLQPLLSAGEPQPYFVMHPASEAPLVLACDHASDRFPKVLGNLGLDPFARRCHLAVDIGAGPLTEYVADSLGATAVLAQYSRLVVDCNRDLKDASAFLEYGDGIPVPGNRGLDAAEKLRRAETIYEPYHAAIDTELDRLAALQVEPLFIGVHSFTPVLNGVSRRWEIGILWDRDRGLHVPFIEGFRRAGFETGDNEPYSGRAPEDYTIDHHAEARSLPCIGLEVRHDLLGDAAGIARVGNTLCRIIEDILAAEEKGSDHIFG